MKTATYHTTSPIEINEFKKSLIVWAQNQATEQRVQAAIGNTKRNTDHHNAKAESYDMMAKYLEGMEIVDPQPPKPEIKICPDTKRDCEEHCSKLDCYLVLSKEGAFDL